MFRITLLLIALASGAAALGVLPVWNGSSMDGGCLIDPDGRCTS